MVDWTEIVLSSLLVVIAIVGLISAWYYHRQCIKWKQLVVECNNELEEVNHKLMVKQIELEAKQYGQ